MSHIRATDAFVLLGHALFAGLFILAYMHFRERVIHVDSALQIFKWVQKPGVEVEAYRYSAVFPQLLVKLAKGLGFGLDSLLRIASLGHVLVGYIIFLLAAHVWRVGWVAAAAVLATVLCTRLTFYGIVLEANYLISYPFLLAAVLEGPAQRGRTWFIWGLLLFTVALVLLVHPVGFLIALFVLAFFLFARPVLRPVVLPLAIVSVLWGLLGRKLLPPSGYESDLYAATLEGAKKLADLGNMPSMDFLLGHTWGYTTHYLPAWILLATALVLLALQRAWPLFILTLAGTLGYALLNVLTYHAGEVAVMMEKNFLPLATLIALPLLFAVSQRSTRWQAWAVLPFALVVFVQFRSISFAARPAHARYAAMEELVQEIRAAGMRKVVLTENDMQGRGIGVVWALPFETLLSSSLQEPGQSVTAVLLNDLSEAEHEGVYLAPWNTNLPSEDLDQRYFQLPGSPYSRFSGSLP
ncbi:MAG: hypothetical protein WEC15_04090 [Flavobacteriales bacterium]